MRTIEYRQLLKRLREFDPKFSVHTRRGKGSHRMLYHPDIVITLTLLSPVEQGHYELVCTYALRKSQAMPDSDNRLKPAPTLSSEDIRAPNMPNMHEFN